MQARATELSRVEPVVRKRLGRRELSSVNAGCHDGLHWEGGRGSKEAPMKWKWRRKLILDL